MESLSEHAERMAKKAKKQAEEVLNRAIESNAMKVVEILRFVEKKNEEAARWLELA